MMNVRLPLPGYDREWLDAFKKLNHLESDAEAVIKLIQNYKAWNKKLSKQLEGK